MNLSKIAMALTGLLFVGTAQAEEIMVEPTPNTTRSSQRFQKPVDLNAYVVRGAQLSVGNSDFDGQIEDSSGFITDKMDSKFTVGLGYANIGVRSLGGIADVRFTQFDGGDSASDPNAIRLSGSIAYGFARHVYAFVGINLNKYGNTEESFDLEELGVQVGNQVGFGLQLNHQFGLNFAYVTTRNNGTFTSLGNTVQFKADGPEFGLTATF